MAKLVRKQQLNKGSKAFTLVELLVVVAVIALLAAILFPTFARARTNARRASCQSNMRQIGLAVQQYKQDFDEIYPRTMYIANDGSIQTIGWSAIHNYQQSLDPYIKTGRGTNAVGNKSGVWWGPSDPDLNDPHLWGSFTNNGLFTGVPCSDAKVQSPASTIYATLRADNWRTLVGAGSGIPTDDSEFYDMCLDPWDFTDPNSFYHHTRGRVVPPKSLFPNDPAATNWNSQIATTRYFGSTLFLYADGHVKSGRFEQTYRSGTDNDWDLF